MLDESEKLCFLTIFGKSGKNGNFFIPCFILIYLGRKRELLLFLPLYV